MQYVIRQNLVLKEVIRFHTTKGLATQAADIIPQVFL